LIMAFRWRKASSTRAPADALAASAGSSPPRSAQPSVDTCVFHVQGIDHPTAQGQFSKVNLPIYP
jgi:hypothetical protein